MLAHYNTPVANGEAAVFADYFVDRFVYFLCSRTDVDAVVDEIARKEVLITQNKLAQVRNLVISILCALGHLCHKSDLLIFQLCPIGLK